MAQIKSQKKRILTNEKSHVSNSQQKSTLRTAIKKVRVAVEANLAKATELLVKATSLIDKSVSDGVQKQNTANRQKSSLNKLVDTIR